jgi:hypothetical protein
MDNAEADIITKVNKINPTMSGDGVISDGTFELQSGITKANGSNLVNVFSIIDSVDDPFFSVKENGDVSVGDVLTVNGTGSYFTGDVSIGDALTVDEFATVNADFTADIMTLTGDFTVLGNTILGDQGTTTINGIATAVTQPVANSSTRLATTQYVRNFVESGTYTVDGGTF